MTQVQMSRPGLESTCSRMQEELLASLAQVKQTTDCAITNVGVLSAILQGSHKLPELYVQPKDLRDTSKVCKTEENIELPLVDLSIFSKPSSDPGRAEALVKMANSCKTWGFVQILGHGVDVDAIKASEKEARSLFELPVSVKEKALRVPGALYGYGANSWLNLPAMNWAESFHINRFNVKEYAAKLWPTDHEPFCTAVQKYVREVEDLGHRVRRFLSEGLGLSPDCFDGHFLPAKTVVNLRINFYPPCPDPSKALGLRPHRDPHFLTLLHQDGTGGLQIWNESRDEWFNVKPVPNSFVVNVGDMFQVASNGIYRSVLHRAVVKETKSRLSMASFYNTTASLVSPDELITPERPQRYRPFSWTEYAKAAYTTTTGAVSQVDQLYGI